MFHLRFLPETLINFRMHSVISSIIILSLAFQHSLAQNYTFPPDPTTNLSTLQISDRFGNRSVSYYLNNGYAVVEGDIVYGTEAELLSRSVNRGSNSNVTIYKRDEGRKSRRSMSLFSPQIWPSRVITYQYTDTSIEATFDSVINQAIANWKAKVPCLKFQKRAIGTNTGAWPGTRPADAILIAAGDPTTGACSAPLGGPGVMFLINGCGVNELTHELVSKL